MIYRVERIDEKLRDMPKPVLEPIKEIFLEPGDTFVLAAGFEERCLGSLQYLEATRSKNFTAILINYEPHLEDNRVAEIKQSLINMDVTPEEMTYDRHNPAGGGEALVEKLERLGRPGVIYLDISAMSRFFIVQALVALGKAGRFSDTRVIYSEARNYPPDEDEVDREIEKNGIDSIYRTMFISAGVYEVTIVPELASVAMYGQPVRLVAFPSFNTDQFASLRGDIQPFSFSFIHGMPPSPENAWRPEAIKKLNHTDGKDIKNKQDLEASTLYYQETLEHLLKIYDEYNYLERIFIAPTGSKMQAVAVGIFRTFMKDVQIVYPTPRRFPSPKRYTEGVKNIYSLDLKNFNSLKT